MQKNKLCFLTLCLAMALCVFAALPNALAAGEEGKPIPRIYHSTGSEDFLLDAAHFTRDFFGSFEGNPFDYIYEEDPGAHTWEYWDDHIQRFLAYIQK